MPFSRILFPVFFLFPVCLFGQPAASGAPATLPSSPSSSRAPDSPAAAEHPMSTPLPVKAAPPAPSLTVFDLDFPGGTPKQLVAAIQKSTGRPLNAIIPTEYAAYELPPLRMNHVNVAQLFQALSEARVMTRSNRSTSITNAGFRTADRSNLSDSTIWTFFTDGSPPMAKMTRFYLLTPYLDHGLTVDDITTAIQTSWKMRGDNPAPQLTFHRETKLLIAVGDSDGLETIDLALGALNPVKKKTDNAPADTAAAAEKKS
jgi:hypothetical protein